MKSSFRAAEIQELETLASDYNVEASKNTFESKVNNTHYINLFHKWYFGARDLFTKTIDNSDLDLKDFVSIDINSGNGYTQARRFRRIYPLFQQLLKKIQISEHQQMIKDSYTYKGFIVHGHNHEVKNEVARFIEKELDKQAIILHEEANQGMTVIEKFEANSDVDFAVALWTSDDFGKAKSEDDLKGRARQNVIFETGYFVGKLGRGKVIILYESGVEKPSDYDGVVYISLGDEWRFNLQKEISAIYK